MHQLFKTIGNATAVTSCDCSIGKDHTVQDLELEIKRQSEHQTPRELAQTTISTDINRQIDEVLDKMNLCIQQGEGVDYDYYGKSHQVDTPFSLDEAKQQLKALLAQQTVAARKSELEMFKKIEIMDMSPAVTAHISRRYKALQSPQRGNDETTA